MEVREFYSLTDKTYWIDQIKKSDWRAGQSLYNLLSEDKFKKVCGEHAKVFLLTDNQSLLSFCTLVDVDDIRDTDLHPWVGFAYTFPQYRGHRYLGILLNFAYETAKNDGASYLYISTEEIGLYEKYGYTFIKMMMDANGKDSRIYRLTIT